MLKIFSYSSLRELLFYLLWLVLILIVNIADVLYMTTMVSEVRSNILKKYVSMSRKYRSHTLISLNQSPAGNGRTTWLSCMFCFIVFLSLSHVFLCLFVLLHYVQVNIYSHGGTISLPNHTLFLGKLEQAVNQQFVIILLLVTDNSPC